MYFLTADLDDFSVGSGDQTLRSLFTTPVYIPPDTLFLVSQVRTDASAGTNGGGRASSNINPMGSYVNDADFELDIEWRSELRITSLVPDTTGFGHGEQTGEAYYQEIRYSTEGPQISDNQIADAVGRSRDVVSPTENGVLYVVVTAGGTGYTGTPTAIVTGGGGSGATLLVTTDGDAVMVSAL